MSLTAEEIQAVQDHAKYIRFKIDGRWDAPIGYKGHL